VLHSAQESDHVPRLVSKAYVNLLEAKINRLEEELRKKEKQPQNAGQKQDNDQADIPSVKEGVPQHTQPESISFAMPAAQGTEPASCGH
jgi:hypothetical protein